jgi:hypothetical protein
MTTYYRITDSTFHELTAEEYAARQANGKAVALRLYVIDAKPAPSASQVVVDAGVVVGPVEAHQTWSLRSKTSSEQETEALLVERAQIDAMLADITAQRAVDRTTWDALTANQLRAEQWRDRQILLRFVNFMARRVKQEIAA